MLKTQNENRQKDKEDASKAQEIAKEDNRAAIDQMAKAVREGIKEEIKEVLKPWEEKTLAVEKKTEALAEEVSTLTKELAEIKQQLSKSNTWSEVVVAGGGSKPKETAVGEATLTGANTAPVGMRTVRKGQEKESIEEAKKEEVLDKARRTLGFGPIKAEDVARQFKECNMFGKAQNETEAKEMAIIELMHLDMKISKEELKEMEIARVFSPRRENSEMLYCEFKRMSSVYKVFQHSRHMRRGTNISPYIPKEYYHRYRKLEEICYHWRKNEGARTRVKMGKKGLEVGKKDSGELDYSQVPIDYLGELPEVAVNMREESREDRSLTSSPPAGRPGYTPTAPGQQGKRERSKSTTKSPGSRSPPNKKTAEGDGRKEDDSEKVASGEKRSDKDMTSPSTRGLLKRPDLGKVVSIQASTPTKKISDHINNIEDSNNSPIFRKATNAV